MFRYKSNYAAMQGLEPNAKCHHKVPLKILLFHMCPSRNKVSNQSNQHSQVTSQKPISPILPRRREGAWVCASGPWAPLPQPPSPQTRPSVWPVWPLSLCPCNDPASLFVCATTKKQLREGKLFNNLFFAGQVQNLTLLIFK